MKEYIDKHCIRNDKGEIVGMITPTTTGKTTLGQDAIMQFAKENNLPIWHIALEGGEITHKWVEECGESEDQ